MKFLFTLISSILLLHLKAQTYLYNQNGISLSYTTSVKKSVFCNEENKPVNFINLHYTISNNSGQSARISSRLQMCNDAFAYCVSEDGVSHFEGPDFQDNRYMILKSGESYYGDVGDWYYGTDASPCSWDIIPEFPQQGTTLKVNVDLTPTKPKAVLKPTYGIYQNDNINNPKPQTNGVQKQKAQDVATDNAMKAWQNSYQQNQNQINGINSKPQENQLQNQQQLQQQQLLKQQQAKANLNQLLAEQQQQQQQTQLEFANAQTASDNAFQSAIANGRKESGALLDATFAGASQISDNTGQLVYTGVGLAVSLLAHLGEKKEERLEKEAAAKRDEEQKEKAAERTRQVIAAKRTFITDAMTINKYAFADLISKDRYAALFIKPNTLSAETQNIYFTIPTKVLKYADSTYPLKSEIEKKLLNCVDNSMFRDATVYTLYPIINIDQFQDEFTKKMGSGHLVYLDAALLSFNKLPFYKNRIGESNTDFWGNPIKKEEKKKEEPKKTAMDKSFWDQ